MTEADDLRHAAAGPVDRRDDVGAAADRGAGAGVVVGLFQALTSVQEMTLTFVPKVGVMLVVFWVSMSFMTATLVRSSPTPSFRRSQGAKTWTPPAIPP